MRHVHTLIAKTSVLHRLFFIISVIVTAYICFSQLGDSYLENWDEGFYAEVTKQMLRLGNPIVLFWNGNVFLDKTPLNFWVNSILALFLGLTELSVRLPQALAGFVSILLVVSYALKKHGLLPAAAAFSALALNNIYIWRVRTGNLDSLATLLVIGIFFLAISKWKYRYELLGVLFGLLYLQKATVVVFPFAAFALCEALYEWRHVKKNSVGYLRMIAIALGIITLWLGLGSMQIGEKFWQYYIFKADQGVGSISPDKFNTDYLWHVYYSLQRRLAPLFVVGLITLLLSWRKKENLLIFILATGLVVQLSFTERNNNWYLVPSIPFWALTIAHGLGSIMKLFRKDRAVFVMISILILIPLSYISYKTLTVNIAAIIGTRASVSEVASARYIRANSQADEAIMRLDFSYPVTLYYSDRETHYYTRVDSVLLDEIARRETAWVVGKKDVVQQAQALIPSDAIMDTVELNDEIILQVDYASLTRPPSP